MPSVEAKVIWQDSLRFTGTGSLSKLTVPLNVPAADGTHEGASPMELLLVALGGCTGMDVISILGKMRQEVTGYEVRVRGERAAGHPKVYTDIQVEHIVKGRNLNAANVEKAVRLSETKYCPVSSMLSRAATVRFTFEICEE